MKDISLLKTYLWKTPTRYNFLKKSLKSWRLRYSICFWMFPTIFFCYSCKNWITLSFRISSSCLLFERIFQLSVLVRLPLRVIAVSIFSKKSFRFLRQGSRRYCTVCSLFLSECFFYKNHCVKSIRILSFFYSVRIRENTNQKNSEYGYFSRSERR